MQKIYLGKGHWALVDDCDFDLCSMYSWTLQKINGYAVAYERGTGRKNQHYVLLHVLIGRRMGFPEIVDHEDLDKLNCQRYNLRAATKSQDGANKRVQSNNKLGAKGIDYLEKLGKYRASINNGGKREHIGVYETLEEAKAAYKVKAIKYFGEFARWDD